MFGFSKRLTHLDASLVPQGKSNFDLCSPLDFFFLIQNRDEREGSLSTKFIAVKRPKQFSYVNQN